jgi:predicted phosphodiesterase
MQIISHNLPDSHDIVLFGDTHEGSAFKHKEEVAKLVDYVATTKNTYAVHMGDLVEGIVIDDKRYDAESVDSDSPQPLLQYQNAIKEIAPIKNKLLTILEGNHDRTVGRRMGNFVEGLVCKELGVPFGTVGCKLTIKNKDSKQMYKMFLAHKMRNTLNSNAKDPIQKEANIKAAMKDQLRGKCNDAIIMGFGHTHKLLVQPPSNMVEMYDDGVSIKQEYKRDPGNARRIDPDLRWYVNTGSFVKLYELGISGYAEIGGLEVVELGYVVVEVRDRKVVNCRKVVV